MRAPANISEARVRQLAHHLATLGRLNLHVLAAEWGVSTGDLVTWLSALHAQGRFERLEKAPYFRVRNPPGIAGRH